MPGLKIVRVRQNKNDYSEKLQIVTVTFKRRVYPNTLDDFFQARNYTDFTEKDKINRVIPCLKRNR